MADLFQVDVFERDNRLVTKVDLRGVKKDDVKVEVMDGHLAISGKWEFERSYGSFYRMVPLPDGTTDEDVKATFADGVLEVSVPLPRRVEAKPRTVPIEDGRQATGAAA